MILFHDVLLLDNVLCLHEPLHIRRRRLENLIVRKAGEAEIAERVKIDFRDADGLNELRDHMAFAIAQGWEGLVVKDWNARYLSFNGDVYQIKLKKDYIPGWGDSADLVVVGGRYDATEASTLGDRGLSWTTFNLACLTNKDALSQPDVKPRFRVVGTVGRPCLRIADLRHLNDHGKLCQLPFGQNLAGIDIESSLPPSEQPTELFMDPAVVEVVGAGFDRPPNERFLTLRFPRIQKIFHDRTYADSLDFAEYQRLAEQSAISPKESHGRHQKKKKFEIPKASQLASASASSSVMRHNSHSFDLGTDATLDCRAHTDQKTHRVGALGPKRKRSPEPDSTFPLVHKKMKKTTASEESDEGRTSTHSPSTIHTAVSDVKSKNRHSFQRSNMSQICRPHRKTSPGQLVVPTCEDLSRPMPLSIPSPLLCDRSLQTLFNDPCWDLARRFEHLPMEITPNKGAFLDSVKRQMMKTGMVEGRDPIHGLVLVHWPSTSDVFNGIKSWISVLEDCEPLLTQPGTCEINFLDWKALEAFASPSQDTLHVIEKLSCGKISCGD